VCASGMTRFNATPNAGGRITRMLSARIRASGIDLAPLLSKAGLTVEQIDNPGARLKVQNQIRFLELAADSLQDDLLGFHLARDFDLREIGLLYYVLASSKTLSDAIHNAERYSRISNEGISLQFSGKGETAIALSYVGVERRADRHQIEFWLTSMVRLCRQLTNRRLIPSRVRVVHRRSMTPDELKSFLGCGIEYGCDVDDVAFSESAKLLPIVSADRYLNELLTAYCGEVLEHRGQNPGGLRSNLENEIAQLLPHGDVRAEDIARRMGMSHRTLARRLSAERWSFAGILDELKADLAKRYLRDDDLPISNIAWLLGYREGSAFTHAFKRWTGVTPRQFRAERKAG
jgi:AraC-like DNA-binding protein